ncbi:chemotaxis protein CheB [Methanobacterium sp.]|uniref:chemotaxis protein CheB n=1 Tax=Methanobacterium sp. TaxID=2164 RepID=UPI003C793241
MADKIEKKFKDNYLNTSRFLYVGIGASAGGLDALKKFLSNIPENSGSAFIIVQHMDPTHKSGLVNILDNYTDLEVLEIVDGVQVESEHVYVIPPNKDLGILDGKLQLMEPIEPHGLRMPINYFFTSLAEDQGDKSVGIILSGFGTDGSIGLKSIKANGGICIAQDPHTAGSEGMPSSAINTGLVDIILAPEEMPEKLLSYKNSSSKILKKILTPEDRNIQALRKIFILIRNRTGHDFSQYKKSTVFRRVGRRMNLHQIEDISQYLRYLQENTEELDLLFKEFLINVTNFFRDPEAFASLKNGALKDLISEKSDYETIRVWVPGCSTGEEVYSIAIIIKELLEETGKKLEVQIFGTDLDSLSIKVARSGTYTGVITDISKERLNKYFYKKDNEITIKDDIRDMVVFANHNVIKDPPFTKLDLISCRNLLIYLETEAQEKVLSKFNYSLKKNGILFLGPSESIGEFIDSFSVIDSKWKIYKRFKSNESVFDITRSHTLPYNLHSSKYWDTQFGLKDVKPKKVGNITLLAEKKLIDLYAPPSVLINDLGEILFIHGRLGKYLEPSPGRARMNIVEMANEEIKLQLNSAIQNAISTNEDVVLENLMVEKDKNPIKLVVKPLKDPEFVNGLLIVSFEESSIHDDAILNKNIYPISNSENRTNALETELKRTKERLNITIEDMTTSNEELKSANEELQSMNEESQSTNEELETSKEELQSINEELTIVNSELQTKIDELSVINDDMTNLFNSTEIATIFVDNELKIRRFTDEATKIIKLIKSDVGRSLGDIVSSINYHDLVDDIEKVIDKVAYKEKEVNDINGHWYKVRIMPYKTSKNIIDGATITFIDISSMKNTQEKLQDALNYAQNIIYITHEPLLVLDNELIIVSANKSFYDTFKLKKSDAEGEKLYEISEGGWNIPSIRNILSDIINKNKTITDFEFEQTFKEVGHKKMILNAKKIHRSDMGKDTILFAMTDKNI